MSYREGLDLQEPGLPGDSAATTQFLLGVTCADHGLAIRVRSGTVPGYHSLSQHLSEMGLMPGLPARAVRLAPMLSGMAIIVFSLALLGSGRRFALTALTSTLFGVAMFRLCRRSAGTPSLRWRCVSGTSAAEAGLLRWPLRMNGCRHLT